MQPTTYIYMRIFHNVLFFVVLSLCSNLIDYELRDIQSTLNSGVIPDVSYYELTSVVDLNGGVICLPDNITILFKGGMFKNGTISVTNATFIGTRGFYRDVILKGSVNGPANAAWYQLERDDVSFDIGPIINTLADSFQSIIIPEGNYFFQTPIVASNIKSFILDGNLLYNGESTQLSAISFTNSVSCFIELKGSVRYSGKADAISYTKKKQTSITGLNFVNIKQSFITISDVRNFNTNIKISGIGDGNSYNQYHLGLSYNSNIHLHIYQRDDNGKIGWCNENIFYGGRFGNPSSMDQKKCETVAIFLDGDHKEDTYNRINSLLFIKPSTEGFAHFSVYAKNAYGCQWLYGRNEGSNYYAKFVGNCRQNGIIVSYGPHKIDISECLTYPLSVPEWSSLNIKPKLVHTKQYSYYLDVKDNQCIDISVPSGSIQKARIGIIYYDNKGNIVTGNNLASPRSMTSGSFYYSKERQMWLTGSETSHCSFYVPQGVDKISIMVFGNFPDSQIRVAPSHSGLLRTLID